MAHNRFSGNGVMIKKILFTLCAAVLAISAVSAQDTTAPTAGIHVIAQGFMPDPYIVTVRGGGDQDAMLMADGCMGHISETPNTAFIYETPAPGFRIFFISDVDATLIVQNPEGNFICNDDRIGRDPAVEIIPGGAGTYLVWVGSYDSTVSPAGYLMLTEVYDTVAGHILTPISNFVTSYIPMEAFVGPAEE
ncbi:MAG: hypothetical protein IAE89_11095 [Anaerolineae bacterium]|nr:hypothetical protein [Anaerolineae bacterium]